MATFATRDDFRNYILEELGAPQLNVELTQTQIDNAIDEAVDMVTRYLYGELNVFKYMIIPIEKDIKTYDFKHLISSEPIDSPANKEYQRVVNIIDLESGPGGSLGYTVNYYNSPLNQVMNDMIYSGQDVGANSSMLAMTNYETAMQYLDMWQDTLGGKYYGNFDILTKEFHITPTPKETGTGVVTVYQRGELIDIYNHIHTKRYAVNKALFLWGQVLSKYEGMVMPDGTVVQGLAKKEEGKTEMKEILELVKTESEQPIFAIG